MTNEELVQAYPEDEGKLLRCLKTQEWFNKLAEAASKSDSLFSKKGKHGGEDYVVKLHNNIVAVSFEDEDGDRHYMDLI